MRYSSTSSAFAIPKYAGSAAEQPAVKPDFWVLPVVIALLILTVYWLDEYFYLDLYRFGLLPRSLPGLTGIFTTPFIHSSLSHLFNNLFPLTLLLLAIRYFYPEIAIRIFLTGYLLTGFLVWMIARDSYHVGASGQVYAFAAFVFFSGIFRGKVHLLAISLLVAFLYGGLFWGIFPFHSHISWESHLAGGFTGFVTALYFRRYEPYYSSPFEDTSQNTTSLIRLDPKSPVTFETSVSDVRYRHIQYHCSTKAGR